MAVSLSICNLALGDVRASSIAEIGEATLEAQLCSRYYPHCLSMMLDDYTWAFTKKIATLAELSSNDRASEWAHAYSLPADCAQAIRLVPSDTMSTSYVQWNYPWDQGIPPNWWSDFIVEAGVLYTQVDSAVLEYASNAADEAVMPPLFREALRKLLAANLAIPLRDDNNLKVILLKEAEAARQAAIANDMNRYPTRGVVDEVAWARR